MSAAATPSPRAARVRTGRRIDAWRLAPVTAAAIGAATYLAIDPHTVDLAAHYYRTGLFAREGFTIWNGGWYGGHHTPAYSVLFPPLAWLIGVNGVGVLAALASSALFAALARGHWGERARWGSVWFGLATATLLFTGRIPFAMPTNRLPSQTNTPSSPKPPAGVRSSCACVGLTVVTASANTSPPLSMLSRPYHSS